MTQSGRLLIPGKRVIRSENGGGALQSLAELLQRSIPNCIEVSVQRTPNILESRAGYLFHVFVHLFLADTLISWRPTIIDHKLFVGQHKTASIIEPNSDFPSLALSIVRANNDDYWRKAFG